MVGYLASTDDMFREHGYTGTESHFGVGGKWGGDKARDLDGVKYQWQDTDFEADANLEGHWHVISIETADNAPESPEDIMAWTPKQIVAIVELIVELCRKYDIPPVLIPDTLPHRRGLAYHAQGCTPNIVKGGEAWSTKKGKVCPGPTRIRQFKNVIIPAVQAELAGKEVEALAVTITSAEIDRIWNERNELLLEQAPAGALKETKDRVAAGNLEARAKAGLALAVNDPTSPLSVKLAEINQKLDQLIGLVTPTS
jgi:hypothetical protein